MKKTETEQILEYLKHIYESIKGPLGEARQSSKEPPLSKRVGTLAADTKERFDATDLQFKRVDARFDGVEDRIEDARVQLVDLVERVHGELTGRIIDVDVPGPGGRGGGGRGSGGVPLAS